MTRSDEAPGLLMMQQHMVPHLRTPENSSEWEAAAELEGVAYRARSRRGAPNELARVLVAAGASDRPVRVFSDGAAGWMDYFSLHAMAEWTHEESASKPLHRVRWHPPPDFAAVFRGGKPQNRGELPSPVPELTPEASTAALRIAP